MHEQPRDAHLRRWLRASRGDETQEQLARDIERVTGWHLTRDRYSKYESGSLPIGPKVRGHFVDYWTSRGLPGPDAFDPVASPGEVTTLPGLADLVAALTAQTKAISELVDAIRTVSPVPWPVAEDVADLLRSTGYTVEGSPSPTQPRDGPMDSTPATRPSRTDAQEDTVTGRAGR